MSSQFTLRSNKKITAGHPHASAGPPTAITAVAAAQTGDVAPDQADQ